MGKARRIPLFHMAKPFILINKTKCMFQFTIGYMIDPSFIGNKTFREQVEKCMFTTFGSITEPFIKTKLLKKNTCVLALIMFYDTRSDNIAYSVLICVIYTINKNYVCIDYLDCQ